MIVKKVKYNVNPIQINYPLLEDLNSFYEKNKKQEFFLLKDVSNIFIKNGRPSFRNKQIRERASLIEGPDFFYKKERGLDICYTYTSSFPKIQNFAKFTANALVPLSSLLKKTILEILKDITKEEIFLKNTLLNLNKLNNLYKVFVMFNLITPIPENTLFNKTNNFTYVVNTEEYNRNILPLFNEFLNNTFTKEENFLSINPVDLANKFYHYILLYFYPEDKEQFYIGLILILL